MKKTKLVLIILLSSTFLAASSLEALLDQVSGDRIAKHVATLASDAFEGRFPGTKGELRTTNYLAGQMKSMGLEAPYSGSYLQKVPLQGAYTRTLADLEVKGSQSSLALKAKTDYIASAPHQAGQNQWVDVGFVYVGYGIVAPEYGWDDYGGLNVRGKVVIMRRQEPLVEGLFLDRALSPYALNDAKWEEAARRGAIGVLMIHENESAGYDWLVLAEGAGKIKYSLPSQSDKPVLDLLMTIDEPAVARIFESAGKDWEQHKAASSVKGFKAAVLEASMSTKLDMEITRIESNNVIGVIRGSSRAHEAVVYTAHWDHVGMSESGDDRIFNGAIDNATGTSALLELAWAFSNLEPAPERSIVFIATTAEEQGLLGAHYYADHPLFPLRETAGVFNLDALFPFGSFNGMTIVAMGSSELEIYLTNAAPLVNRTVHSDSSPEFGVFYRSDHYPFAKRGVPAIFAVGGPSPDSEIDEEMIARFTDYGTNGYHKPADEYDVKTWDMAGIVQDVKMFLHAGAHLANDTRFPNWYWGNPFRAIRDAMR